MGSYSATCHLSSLLISENEEMIVLPMAYGDMQTGSTLTYLTNYGCEPLWLATKTIYSGFKYGAIEKETIADKYLLNWVNTSTFEQQKTSFLCDIFFKLKDDDSKVLRYRHHSNSSIFDKLSINANIINPSFDSVTKLFESISSEELLMKNNRLNRIGFISIKKSVYDTLAKGFYKKYHDKVKRNIKKLVNEAIKANEELDIAYKAISDYPSASEDEKRKLRHLQRQTSFEGSSFDNALGFFNDGESLKRMIVQSLSDLLNEKKNLNDMINAIAMTSTIMKIYRDNGKSLFPNSNRYGDMEPVHALNQAIGQQIDTIINDSLKEHLSEYDEEYQGEALTEFKEKKWESDY